MEYEGKFSSVIQQDFIRQRETGAKFFCPPGNVLFGQNTLACQCFLIPKLHDLATNPGVVQDPILRQLIGPG